MCPSSCHTSPPFPSLPLSSPSFLSQSSFLPSSLPPFLYFSTVTPIIQREFLGITTEKVTRGGISAEEKAKVLLQPAFLPTVLLIRSSLYCLWSVYHTHPIHLFSFHPSPFHSHQPGLPSSNPCVSRQLMSFPSPPTFATTYRSPSRRTMVRC